MQDQVDVLGTYTRDVDGEYSLTDLVDFHKDLITGTGIEGLCNENSLASLNRVNAHIAEVFGDADK